MWYGVNNKLCSGGGVGVQWKSVTTGLHPKGPTAHIKSVRVTQPRHEGWLVGTLPIGASFGLWE